ncbi:MAG: nucleotide sugar dehydrogenase [Actinomycetota bacterium]|nr:nucleotide sugar dehydrogenase [Actinomycetota bacterium]
MTVVLNPPDVGDPVAGAPALAPLLERIEGRTAVVAVVGLGYVGLPLALAADGAGFPTIGFDVDPDRVGQLRDGRSYLPGDVDDTSVARSSVDWEADRAVLAAADVLVIAVPTPLRDGSPDLGPVRGAAEAVAAVLRPGQLVVLESTTWPGTTEEVLQPLLEASGLRAGTDFALAFSPERVDPGSSWDVSTTPKVVGGVTRADATVAAAFYRGFVPAVHVTSTPREAEMAKLIENTFRQVNIGLVNELATLAPALGVDMWEALEAAATKPFGYLPFWPGPGVGGHCIAVDPTYLSWRCEQQLGFGVGFIAHARNVNNKMPAYVVSRAAEVLNDRASKALRGSRVCAIGAAYKAGVGDVRESPAVAVIDRLVGAGAEVDVVDPFVAAVDVAGGTRPTVALDRALDGDPDLGIILTPQPGVDLDRLIGTGVPVLDACGATRAERAGSVVLL